MYKVNKIVLIYFCISWLIGLIILLAIFANAIEEVFYFFVFISSINIIINMILMLILFVFYHLFPENKIEFKNSVVLLIFNFPILSLLYFLILTI